MSDGPDLATLESIQQRILWLAVRMVDHANHERLLPPPVGDGGHVKVGGHQASSASMVGIMTALWFGHLNGDDKVAVKPHASPVFHAIKYLTGELDRTWLTRLRELGGLQAYPSRTKDPDVFDFSTGSVGLGAVAPLFAAATRRYIDAHFGARPHARFIALVGDAELDEGNVWEAIADPALQGLGNVTWIVDLNRQSLDRVIPGMKARRLMQFFEESGWHVVEAKYGRRLQEAFARPGGDSLRRHIDDMSNEEYQSLFAFQGAELRQRFLAHADAAVKALLDEVSDDELAPLVQNLGGHDLGELIDCYRQCDAVTDRPSIVWAYTVKGWGLPIAGDPLNHAALLSTGQIASLRAAAGLTPETEWDRFAPGTPEAAACARVGGEVNNVPVPPRPLVPVPIEVGVAPVKVTSTQETFGRLLTGLASHAEVAARLVTTSPDVSVSTNLGGFINKLGVFAPADEPDFLGEGRLLRWRQGPTGHHVELGISEMNLFLMLGQLGLGHELHGEMLLPIGTVYDPFVCRGLDALIYGAYSASRFVVVGTPSGISLAPEGGAHQSTITASIGVELPGVTFVEPAYATALDWLLCDGLRRLADPDGDSHVPAPLDAPDRPGAVRGGAGAPRRRAAADRRAGRRVPPGRGRGGGWSDGEPGRLRRGRARSGGRGLAAGRRGCRGPRDRRDLHGPALRRLALTPARRGAHRHRARRRDPAGPPAPGGRPRRADRHRPRRRQSRVGLGRFGVRRSGGPRRRGRVRPVGLHPRALRGVRPAPRAAGQRRPGRGQR